MRRKAFLTSIITATAMFSIALIFAFKKDWKTSADFWITGNIAMGIVLILWSERIKEDFITVLFTFFTVNFFMNPAAALPPQAVIDFKPCQMFTATTTWQKLKSNDIYRKYILVQNQTAPGGDNVRIEMMAADTAPVGDVGLLIGPGGNYEFFIPPWNAIWVKSTAGSVDGCLVEGR